MTHQMPKPRSAEGKLVICIGDIHGFYSKLQNLWSNLQSQLNPSQFNSAVIIFLGDYCDRGPDTKSVINFLISLPSKYPNQKHIFLAGNHDIAFAAFLGLLPRPLDGSRFEEGWEEYAESEEREGWYKGEGFEDMYLQGRRWSGSIRVKFNTVKGTEYKGSIYDAAPTFESYGVPHGSAGLSPFSSPTHLRYNPTTLSQGKTGPNKSFWTPKAREQASTIMPWATMHLHKTKTTFLGRQLTLKWLTILCLGGNPLE